MAKNKLTETKVRALAKAGIYSDGDGLFLRILMPKAGERVGARSWLFIAKRSSKRIEIWLGACGRGTAPLSLGVARAKADVVRQQLAAGIDPKAAKTTAVTVKTFADCMEAVLQEKGKELANPKHQAQWVMTLRKYAKPLHKLPVAEITLGDVKSCLESHWGERPETADRLRSRIQAVIDYAIAHEWRTTPNPAVWKGRLEKVMPARQTLSRGHHASLPYTCAPATMDRLRASRGTAARAVEFLALTAARTGEARKAQWSEIDLDAKVWTRPANHMKAGVEHRVPLSSRAIDILLEMKQRRFGDFIFAGERDGKSVSDTALTKALRIAAPEGVACTVHGLRSSFRDWAGDMTTHPRDVAEAALAHTLDAVEAAYRRSDALEKRRALMEDWATYLSLKKLA